MNRGTRGPCAGAPGPDDLHDPSFRRRTATDLGRAAERSRHQSADVFQRSTTERSSTGAHCGQCAGSSFARACSDVRRVAAATRRAPGTAAVASLPSIRQTHLQLLATCRVVDARYRALGGSAGPVALRRDPSGPRFGAASWRDRARPVWYVRARGSAGWNGGIPRLLFFSLYRGWFAVGRRGRSPS